MYSTMYRNMGEIYSLVGLKKYIKNGTASTKKSKTVSSIIYKLNINFGQPSLMS